MTRDDSDHEVEERAREARARLSRRSFLKGAGGVAAAGGLLRHEAHAAQVTAPPATEAVPSIAGSTTIELSVNGEAREVEVEPRTTLLSALRHRLAEPLTGAKEVCDRGNCGACTVLVDGRPAYACLLLACDLEGREVTTVEGLGSPEELSDLQRAFCDKDASMCGFCTPGFVVSSTALLAKYPEADEATIRRELSGNLCRCGTYPHVFEAVRSVRDGGAK